MGSPFAPSVALAAANLTSSGYRVSVIDLSLNGTRCACGHPSADQHLLMAQHAIAVVKSTMGW
jgi:hypothetical protein